MTVIMFQPMYSMDLAPADFFLFPKLKIPIATIETIKEKSKKKLLAIAKSTFQECFTDWKKRWNKCILPEDGYFEEDGRITV